MTYPGLTSHRQRHEVAFQFHLVRLGLKYLQQREKEEPEVLPYLKTHRRHRRETLKAQLGSMRDLLHTLFD